MSPTANDPKSWLQTVWAGLESHRENCVPEGADPMYDEEWDNICTAMAWIAEAVGVDPTDPDL